MESLDFIQENNKTIEELEKELSDNKLNLSKFQKEEYNLKEKN